MCVGCPFRHWDESHLSSKISAEFKRRGVDNATAQTSDILRLVKDQHYQIACQRYFTATHKGAAPDAVGNHPNTYFDASRKWYIKQAEGGGSGAASTASGGSGGGSSSAAAAAGSGGAGTATAGAPDHLPDSSSAAAAAAGGGGGGTGSPVRPSAPPVQALPSPPPASTVAPMNTSA